MRGRRTSDFDAVNAQAARLILANLEKHNMLAVQWAKRWLARHHNAAHADAERREKSPFVEKPKATAAADEVVESASANWD